MITLDTLQLPDNIHWNNEFDAAAIPQNIMETLGGAVVPQQLTGIIPKKTIILEAIDDGDRTYGALSRAQVQSLKTMEASWTVRTLNYHGQLFEVIIVAGGVQFSPIFPHPDALDTDLYTGQLLLQEV